MFGYLELICLNVYICTYVYMYILKYRFKIFRSCYRFLLVGEKYIYKFIINIINVFNIEFFDSCVFLKM